jgi:uncharacterized protein with ATP-grasp and redox domains
MSRLLPRLPIPEPLRGDEKDSFAEDTIKRRMPNAAKRAINENTFPDAIVADLQKLAEDLPSGKIRNLRDRAAPDTRLWDAYCLPHLNRSWLSVPWFFAEKYFYRRILEATQYFEDGPTRHQDPFAYQKRLGLETTRDEIRKAAASQNRTVEQGDWRQATFASLLESALWGNQHDLSLWAAGEQEQPAKSANRYLLVDDSARVSQYVDSVRRHKPQVDIVADNAGFELINDFLLIDYLLSTDTARRITLHLKPYPTFVSDAMPKDIPQTIEFLCKDRDDNSQDLGKRLSRHIETNHLVLTTDYLWTSPLPFWEMPPDLEKKLADAALVITKGDANYRRLHGDRMWPYTTKFEDVVNYFPAPLVALRTLKSELITGLTETQVEKLNHEEKDWLTNGKRGVIQALLGTDYLALD